MRVTVVRAALLSLLVVASAAAQFDPAFNHLKCYRIKGPSITTRVRLQNQFGREDVAQLTPVLLCTPTAKLCCKPGTQCQQEGPCPLDPTPNQPASVDHFKCYKMKVKTCTDPTCATLAKPPKNIVVDLTDQFGPQTNVVVGAPQLLCAPVLKEVVSPTTTTTTTTTITETTVTETTTTSTSTTMDHCRQTADTPPTCGGPCPSGLTCASPSGAPGDCGCVPTNALCQPVSTAPSQCINGPCPNPGMFCETNPSTNVCDCHYRCGSVAPCMGFCPSLVQVCQGAAPQCGCCVPTNGPCFQPSDCCSNVCNGNSCQ